MGAAHLEMVRVTHLDHIGQHVFRQRQHDRARPAVGGAVEGLAHQFRNAVRIVDLGHPFHHRAIHAAEVDFLEGLALDLVARRPGR
jgi:hypothetical protein